ncbi:titin-like isoform X1 [Lutzomyia longipalpis]|uniref:titin-like isoform X1 n=1 Tax=Lutzomyia longipalpis TaxID=7200 RepID=UPI002483EEEF|nr:titin-like isoform X1 [Lutzomyia longipalpis]XP_055683060.1 titin-like isoform X1 [Lutzomyia longipalpis]
MIEKHPILSIQEEVICDDSGSEFSEDEFSDEENFFGENSEEYVEEENGGNESRQDEAESEILEAAEPEIPERAEPEISEEAEPAILEDMEPEMFEDAELEIPKKAKLDIPEQTEAEISETSEPETSKDVEPESRNFISEPNVPIETPKKSIKDQIEELKVDQMSLGLQFVELKVCEDLIRVKMTKLLDDAMDLRKDMDEFDALKADWRQKYEQIKQKIRNLQIQ